jgi:hydrogenase nickel incorporation protein HypA/HybF
MHELSIVLSIIDIASQKAQEAEAAVIEEIELDIGQLSTIDLEAFDFAWQRATKNTLLEHAARSINVLPGQGKCVACKAEFPVDSLYSACPECGEFAVAVCSGRELRVKSLVVR